MAIEDEDTTPKAFNTAAIRKAVREIIRAVGEDPTREGLRETPRRVADMYAESATYRTVASSASRSWRARSRYWRAAHSCKSVSPASSQTRS